MTKQDRIKIEEVAAAMAQQIEPYLATGLDMFDIKEIIYDWLTKWERERGKK